MFRSAFFVAAVICFATEVSLGASVAEQKVKSLQLLLARDPGKLQAYNDLALALCERAQEIGQITYLQQADTALLTALQISPGDYSAKKARVPVLLGLHRWAEALETAQSLNHQAPDDLDVWGSLAEANLALGNYPEAQKAAQWMIDLRPGNAAAFLPAAKLRELYGDLEGAIDFVNENLRRTPDTEPEKRSLLLADLARLTLLNGKPLDAAMIVAEALRLYPANPLGLQVSARIETSAGHFAEAASLLGRRVEQVKTAAALYEYAQSLERAGRKPEAASAYREFEIKAQAESAQPYNANRELIFYYADHANQPAKALALAERERLLRHDVLTLDALAWALFRSGKLDRARREIKLAVDSGTRDPDILAHRRSIQGTR